MNTRGSFPSWVHPDGVFLDLNKDRSVLVNDDQIDRAVGLSWVEYPVAEPHEVLSRNYFADVAVDVPGNNHMIRRGSSQRYGQRGGLPGRPTWTR